MAAFPPTGPTGLTAVIPSYLYQQYSDDDNLQGFIAAFNQLAQQYVDFFNNVNLPIYTGPLVAGALLDWVAQGLYGTIRPALPSGRNQDLGPLDTWALNTLALNARKVIGPSDYYATSDDTFRRILTWNFFKGDGFQVNVRWLKRRVMRFLNGPNGINYNVDQTYQVSVSFGADNQVNIVILNGERTLTGGAVIGRFPLNTQPLNAIVTTFTPYAPLAEAPILAAAIEAGVVNLPFQYSFTCTVIG